MAPENFVRRPLDIVTACRAVDLPILRVAVPALRRFLAYGRIHVFTARSSFPKFRSALDEQIELHDEDEAIADLTLAALKMLSLPGFPKGAGWYFQQLLKYSFCYQQPADDFYLIWDADTVPLRPMELFDAQGRMIFTAAQEFHQPYFDTYRRLLGEEPPRGFSFIAQHMVVQKSILRELLSRIETNFPGPESWAWKIMRNLSGTSTNLFSEYEMLGNFVMAHHPERASYQPRAWLREGSRLVNGPPKPTDLARLAKDYEFAAFEASQRPFRGRIRALRSWWRGHGQ